MSTPPRAPRGESGAVLDGLPDAVLHVRDGVVIDANLAAEKAFAGGESLVGEPLDGLLRDGERDRLTLIDEQRALGWTVPSTCCLRFSRSDGTTMMADVRWRRLAPGELVLTARDVTDVTRAEALMARLAQLPSGMDGPDALLDASEPVFLELGWKVAFTELVPGGSITRRMIAPAGDPVGEYGRSLVGRWIPLAETAVLGEILRTGEPLFLDNLPSTQKGAASGAVKLSDSMNRARVAPSAWCPIRVGGKVTHCLAVTGGDITTHDFVAIQLFSAQLAAASKLAALRLAMVHRERLAAVGEMAAVLAHEVRNPLGVMFTALGTLSRAVPGATDDWRRLLGILHEEADRLQCLVTDLLEFSNSATPLFDAVLLRPVVQDALHAAEHDSAFSSSNPPVHVEVAEGIVVHTDRVLLRRILLNVLVNAFQHVPAGGSVGVTATVSPSEVALVVANDGAPLAPEVAKRVFEPFFTTKPRGTGLGLAIVRRLCTDVGARVEVLPREAGVAFQVVLPRSDR